MIIVWNPPKARYRSHAIGTSVYAWPSAKFTAQAITRVVRLVAEMADSVRFVAEVTDTTRSVAEVADSPRFIAEME